MQLLKHTPEHKIHSAGTCNMSGKHNLHPLPSTQPHGCYCQRHKRLIVNMYHLCHRLAHDSRKTYSRTYIQRPSKRQCHKRNISLQPAFYRLAVTGQINHLMSALFQSLPQIKDILLCASPYSAGKYLHHLHRSKSLTPLFPLPEASFSIAVFPACIRSI